MSKIYHDSNKVAIIGGGKVGMTAAYAILLEGVADEILLVGRNKEKLMGEKLDLEHGMSFLQNTKISITDDYAELAGTDIVVVTAGAAQKPGDTRLDLAKNNIAIIDELIPKIVAAAPAAIIILVANPVDVLTYRAYQIAGLPKGQIFGSGTILDTSRFRFHLGEMLKINPRSIHTYLLGEHGDSSFPFLSGANIGGQSLTEFKDLTPEKIDKAYMAARDAAYKIIASKGATYYAIGVMISNLVATVLRDSRSVLPVSIPLHNYYGHSGVALSVPCIVGRNGVEETLKLDLDKNELTQLSKSVTEVKACLQ